MSVLTTRPSCCFMPNPQVPNAENVFDSTTRCFEQRGKGRICVSVGLHETATKMGLRCSSHLTTDRFYHPSPKENNPHNQTSSIPEPSTPTLPPIPSCIDPQSLQRIGPFLPHIRPSPPRAPNPTTPDAPWSRPASPLSSYQTPPPSSAPNAKTHKRKSQPAAKPCMQALPPPPPKKKPCSPCSRARAFVALPSPQKNI